MCRDEAEERRKAGAPGTIALEAYDELVGIDWRCWNVRDLDLLARRHRHHIHDLRCSNTAVGYCNPSENNKAIAPQIAAQSASDRTTAKIIDPPMQSRGPPRLPTGRQ